MAYRRKRSSFERFAESLHAFGKELQCPICLSLLSEATRLPCNHYFCGNCIKQCINDDPRCPVCKCKGTADSLHSTDQINKMVDAYRVLSLPGSDEISLSQPLTPSKIKQVFSGQTITSSNSPVKRMKEKLKTEIFTKRNPLSFVFLLTGLDNTQRHLVNHVCTNSSVRVVSDYCDEVTHCITSAVKNANNVYLANRTIKYLTAILHHKPIIAFDWIKDIASVVDYSLSENKKERKESALTIDLSTSEFPSWKQYQIRGDLQVQQLCLDGPQQSIRLSNFLFEGMKFCIYGEFKPPYPSKESLTDLIESGGGIVCDSEQSIVLVDESACKPSSSTVVSFLWLLDSISNYQLQPFEMYAI